MAHWPPAAVSSMRGTAARLHRCENASSLRCHVFYYNYADAYISTVRTAMDAELEALGVEFTNFDAQNIQANQTDQINTAITDGYNLLIVNVVENASPDAAQNGKCVSRRKNTFRYLLQP